MSMRHDKFLNDWMISFSLLMFVVVGLVLMTRESPMIITEKDKIRMGEIVKD
jgi:hypothetical protein